MTIIIENGEDGTLWGRIHHGDDILTTAGKDLDEVKQNFIEQLKEFYQIAQENAVFEITYEGRVVSKLDLSTNYSPH